jgi:maltooligosyltrehalose trehalohydrolase
MESGKRPGALLDEQGRARFLVWAPEVDALQLHQVAPVDRLIPMQKRSDGYFEATIEAASAGLRYFYRLPDGDDRPDPASRLQPEGPHGPSAVIDLRWDWRALDWRGLPLEEYVIYELHVGTFTPEGTFDAIISHLPRLREIGITAIELMPVAQFPGERNWGYDGAYPYAVQNSYGGPDGLRRLVDAAHQEGLAVILDVVYNHLGPEGNYLALYGPYFTDRYRTPWGTAINFDGPGSDDVRNYFVHNALQWIDDFRFDALRLDAVHAIIDETAKPFLHDLAEAVHASARRQNRHALLIAESNMNDPRLVRSPEQGGLGLDSQWADDFHHALHVILTGEEEGYYSDFRSISDLARIYEKGWLYSGQYSRYRQRRFGAPSTGLDGSRFVVCIQNHDQVGNRMMGDRLSETLSNEQLRLALGLVILSPFIPLLFMGEEYGETAPFQYFTSHTDPALVEAVRKGRREEFADFAWRGEVPDPDAEQTFERSRINPPDAENEMVRWVRHLLYLRRSTPALRQLDLAGVRAIPLERSSAIVVQRQAGDDHVVLAASFSSEKRQITLPLSAGVWELLADSHGTAPARLDGEDEATVTLDPYHLVVYQHST